MASGMAAKINAKNMDYFKFKKIVVDGNRDDYSSCSREIRTLCDAVQTLSFRDEQFADDQFLDSKQQTPPSSDRQHFDEILTGYRQILDGKRIDPVDIRIKTGWWADTASATGSCGTTGKFKAAALRDTLLAKSNDWRSRHNRSSSSAVEPQIYEDLDRPGVFIFKHRERQCFQFVSRTSVTDKSVFATCNDLLKASFEGVRQVEPVDELAALLVVSMAADWDFYFVTVASNDSDALLCVIENDLILKHDSIWPRGLNRMLHVTSPLEVAELRNSCLRHRWPPAEAADLSANNAINDIDLDRLRKHVKNSATQHHALTPLKEPLTTSNKLPPTAKSSPSSARPQQSTTSSRVNATNGVDGEIRQTSSSGVAKSLTRGAGKQQSTIHSPTATTASTSQTRPMSAPRPTTSKSRVSANGPTVSNSRPQSASSSSASRKDTVSASPSTAAGSGTRQTKSYRSPESSFDATPLRRSMNAPTTSATHGGPVKRATKSGASTPKSLPPSSSIRSSAERAVSNAASVTIPETGFPTASATVEHDQVDSTNKMDYAVDHDAHVDINTTAV